MYIIEIRYLHTPTPDRIRGSYHLNDTQKHCYVEVFSTLFNTVGVECLYLRCVVLPGTMTDKAVWLQMLALSRLIYYFIACHCKLLKARLTQFSELTQLGNT